MTLAVLLSFAAVAAATLLKRDGWPSQYPYCTPSIQDSKTCIEHGKFLVPELNFSDLAGPGDQVYSKYLLPRQYSLSQWTNGKMPGSCEYWAHQRDQFNASDFTIYNLTFSDDCPDSPWVVCHHKRAPNTIDEIASVSEFPRLPT
jgi:hypothetical protein